MVVRKRREYQRGRLERWGAFYLFYWGGVEPVRSEHADLPFYMLSLQSICPVWLFLQARTVPFLAAL
jgi:hypothetical protein